MIKNAFIEAVIGKLTVAIRHYAESICEKCINPNIHLLLPCTCKQDPMNSTTETIWLLRGYHRVALRFLSEYDVLNSWDKIIYRETIPSSSIKNHWYRIQYSKGLKNLTKKEIIEARKNWTYFKKKRNRYGIVSCRG